jgi:2-polyprenyl-3-methyl-5-hydroxy-6-metoxy-1,4-benzoquinol methylase
LEFYFTTGNQKVKINILIMGKTCSTFRDCKEEKVVLFTKLGYPVCECKKCGHRFTDVPNDEIHLARVYSDEYFFEGKSGYPNYLEEKEILFKSGVRFARLVSKYISPGKVLDVGCAAGFILKGFEKAGWDCHGVEPNDTMASYGRDELKLDVRTGGLETFDSNEKFDLIIMIEVIGIFYDIDKAMLNVSNLLNKDGLVLVESMNMKSTLARLLGKSWHEYCPPSVIHWFSDKTLSQLFNYYGFELIAKGYPAKRLNVKHAISVLEENSPNIIFKKKILDYFSRKFGKATLYYPPLDVKWYIFKKL